MVNIAKLSRKIANFDIEGRRPTPAAAILQAASPPPFSHVTLESQVSMVP